MLASCPDHPEWNPKRGPGGNSARALCPHCVVWRDIQAGRVEVDDDEQIRERGPRSQRRHLHYGLVADSEPVSRYGETPLMAELWSAHLARTANARRAEQQGLVDLEAARKRRERQEKPRQRRLMFSRWADGRWENFFAPERRPSVTFEIEDAY